MQLDTAGKAVGAFRDSDGNTIYALFEKFHEGHSSASSLRKGVWRFYLMGPLEQVLRTIFWMAASLEISEGSDATESPEDYIEGWLTQLTKPYHLSNTKLDLFIDDSERSPIAPQRAARVSQRLHDLDQAQLAARLEDGHHAALTLYHDWQILEAIFEGSMLAKQRIFGNNYNPKLKKSNPLLSYHPIPSTVIHPFIVPKLFKLRSSTLFIIAQDEWGDWRSEGNAQGYIANFIDDYWRRELEQPGLFRQHLQMLRQTVESAAELSPEDFKIAISLGMVEMVEDQDTFNLVTKGLAAIQSGDELIFAIPKNLTQRERLLDSMNHYSRYILASGLEKPN